MLTFDDPELGDRFYDLATDYETYTADMSGNMGLDHEFSHNALMKLANTSAALARSYDMGEDVNISNAMNEIEMAANSITKDPYAGTHADMIRKAAMSITSILDEVQDARFPQYDDAIEEVRSAAQNISKETLTLNQKEDVREFFGRARVAIKAMRESSSSMQ